MGRAKAEAILDLRTSAFKKKLGEVDKRWKSVKKTAFGVGAAFAAVFAGNLIRKGISLGIEFVNIAKEGAAAEARLANALRNRPDISGEGATRLREFADAMQRNTIYTADSVKGHEAMLLAMGMSEEQTRKLIAASADLAAGTGRDLDFAIRNLAKSTSGMLGELGEALPALSAAVKALGENRAEALKAGFAIDFVAKNYRGFAESVTRTSLGSIQQLSNVLQDIKKAAGFGIADALKEMVEEFTGLTNVAKEFNAEMEQLVSATTRAALLDLASSLVAIGGVLGKVWQLGGPGEAQMLADFATGNQKSLGRRARSAMDWSFMEHSRNLTDRAGAAWTEADALQEEIAWGRRRQKYLAGLRSLE